MPIELEDRFDAFRCFNCEAIWSRTVNIEGGWRSTPPAQNAPPHPEEAKPWIPGIGESITGYLMRCHDNMDQLQVSANTIREQMADKLEAPRDWEVFDILRQDQRRYLQKVSQWEAMEMGKGHANDAQPGYTRAVKMWQMIYEWDLALGADRREQMKAEALF